MMKPQEGRLVIQLVEDIRGEKLKKFIDFCFSISDKIALVDMNYNQKDEVIELETVVNKYLADYKIIRHEVTCQTHCTRGGAMPVYYLKNEANIKDRFNEMTTLFNKVTLNKKHGFELEDPAFYKEGEVICSICSHEKMGSMLLTSEEYQTFRKLRVPHDIAYIKEVKNNQIKLEPIIIGNMSYYPLETIIARKSETSGDNTEEINITSESKEGDGVSEQEERMKKLILSLEEYAYQEREKVVIWGWHIEEIPEQIGGIKTLRELEIFDHEVTYLPKSLENLIQLECLRITGNQVEELGFDISRLQKLKTLDLSSMPLKKFPIGITELKALEELYLSAEHMMEIPEAIMKLDKLKVLSIGKIDESKLSVQLVHFIESLKPKESWRGLMG